MKTNFDSKLFEKQIDFKQQSNVFGSSFATSGGTESGSTGTGQDTYISYLDDDCNVSLTLVSFNL